MAGNAFAVHVWTQLVNTSFATPYSYGSYVSRAYPVGSPTIFSVPVAACFPSPATRIGGGTPGTGGGIQYTFSRPVYSIRILVQNLNTTEFLRIAYNGPVLITPYAIQPTDVITFTQACPVGVGSGPTTLSGGDLLGPACCFSGASSPYNGGEIVISDCAGIHDFSAYCNGLSGGAEVVIYFDSTKLPGCSNVYANSPCEGDSLKLTNPGDSLGATYFWVGPYAFTSTDQNPIVVPAPLLYNGGTFRCYKTQGGIVDTDTVVVTIHPRAYVKSITNNSPLCENLLDTLQLRITTPGVPGETWSWVGPNSFVSSLKNPDIYGFQAIDTGTYFVKTATPFGCGDSANTFVSLKLPPPPPKIVGPSPYCFGATFVPFSTVTVSGTSVLWYPSGTGGVGSTVAPVIVTTVAGTYTVYASQKDGLYCESTRDSLTILVKPQIKPSFNWTSILGCTTDDVTFHNTSSGASWYSWDYGDGFTSGDTTTKLTTQVSYPLHKVHKVVLTGIIPGCQDSAIGFVNTTHSVKAQFRADPIICAGGFTTMNDSATNIYDSSIVVVPNGSVAGKGSGSSATVDTGNIYTNPAAPSYLAFNYAWDFGDGSVDNSNTRTPPAHRYDSGNYYRIGLTVTDSMLCKDTTSQLVAVIQMKLRMLHDSMLCISQSLPIFARDEPRVNLDFLQGNDSFNWSPARYLSDSTILNPYYVFKGFAVTTYTLTAVQKTYGCYTFDTARIHSVVGVKLANVTTSTTIMYGRSIQLNSDSEVYYVWKNVDGTLDNNNINNPVATPLATTSYLVYGYDKNGCLDSAYVNVRVDSSMIEDLPSAFTPNGDGLNDIFRPVGIKYQNTVDFRVYNRLGEQVFYSNNSKYGWDGKYFGTPQDIGTYFYVIVVAKPGGDGENVTYKGTVTLIR